MAKTAKTSANKANLLNIYAALHKAIENPVNQNATDNLVRALRDVVISMEIIGEPLTTYEMNTVK